MPKFTLEQQDAINSEGTNILVSAGAGSGKTAVLSERVLRKVNEGVSTENLLILTFTNAAAAEMKERIRNKIKANDNLKDELEKVESAYITTFDSFTLSVVKKYHYLKNLPKNINICDASIIELKKEELLEELFDKLYQEKNEKFISFIKDYFYKNDNELKKYIKSAYKSIDLIYDKKIFLDNYIANFYNEDYIDSLVNSYITLIKSVIKDINNSYNEIIRIDSLYAEKVLLNELFTTNDYATYKKYGDLDVARLPKNSSEELKEEKDKLKKLLNKLKELTKYEDLNILKQTYLNNKKYIEVLLDIIIKYDKLVTNLKYKENMFDFLDIEKMAIDILKENEDVRLFYKNKFNEILIDEYQDTSDIQELFISLISENNVYMVGDIKQSIYRFRNANPIIFKDKYEMYGEKNGGKRIDLNKNFRSREEVLLNINLMFDKIMNAPIGGAEYKKEHQLSFGNTLYETVGKTEQNNNFEILNYQKDEDKIYSKEEIEIFTIARDIKEKVESKYIIFDKDENIQRPAKYNDFAVLLDRTTSFNLYKKIFEYLNVPLSVYKDESIKESINIKIIKNILILINKIHNKVYDNDFRYAYFSVARSYLFKIDDNNLYNIISNKEYFNTEIFKICQTISQSLENNNIYYIVNKIIEEFNFYEKLITIGDISKNYVVLDYILNISNSSSEIFTIDEFINYLDNITTGDLDIKYSLSKEDAEGCYLMTIHKSKGLEFPICYFAGLDKAFNILELKDKFLFSNKYGIIMPYINNGMKTSFVKTLLKNDYINDEISEKLRLLYVALTRAKEKMIFVMDFKNDKDYSYINDLINDYDRINYRSFADIINSINKIVYPYIKNIDINKLKLTKDYNFAKKSDYQNKLSIVNEKILIEENEFEKELLADKHYSKKANSLFNNETKKNIEEGLKIHYMMEHFDFEKLNYDIIPDKYKLFVQKFIKLDILKDYINIYKEYEFIYTDDFNQMHGIIDLLLEYSDKYVIVDYKLKNTTDEAYVNQLNGYKKYISELTNKECITYLYSFVDGKLTLIN